MVGRDLPPQLVIAVVAGLLAPRLRELVSRHVGQQVVATLPLAPTRTRTRTRT